MSIDLLDIKIAEDFLEDHVTWRVWIHVAYANNVGNELL